MICPLLKQKTGKMALKSTVVSRNMEFKSPGNLSKIKGSEKRTYQQLLSEIIALNSKTFIAASKLNRASEGLHWKCGNGQITLQLAKIVGPNGNMTGVDSDQYYIQQARRKVIRAQSTTTNFYTVESFQQRKVKKFHFIYCRFLFSQSADPLADIQYLYQLLKPGGILLLEDMDISQMNCFPNSSAMLKFKTLLKGLYKSRSLLGNFDQSIPEKLRKGQFYNIQHQLMIPHFLNGPTKKIASLTLENQADALQQEGLITLSELQKLQMELLAFENLEQSVISLPCIYQAKAFRLK